MISFCCCPDQAEASQSSNDSQAQGDHSSVIGVNRSARPTLAEGCHVWVKAEALYWKAAEENIPYVIVNQGISPQEPSHIRIKNATFDWAGGYRLSAGHVISHDQWDWAVCWMSIANQGSQSDRGSLPAIGASHLIEPIGYQNTISSVVTRSHGKWKIDLSQAEANLGKAFFVSRALQLRPMGGVRSSWIDHHSHVEFYDPNAQVTTKHRGNWDFWGIGLLAGLQADWMLAKEWSICSFANYTLLGGFSKIKQESPTTDYRFRKSFRCLRAICDFGLGIQWAHCFKQRCRISLKVAYEYHLYPEQNQFINNTNMVEAGVVAGSFTKNPGALTYQGGSFAAQIDF